MGLSTVVSLQKFPKDGVKKLVLQMEKQKLIYEEKALVALQKATQEKTEAVTKAETMQVKHLAFNANDKQQCSFYLTKETKERDTASSSLTFKGFSADTVISKSHG